jgi:hypothetical protein
MVTHSWREVTSEQGQRYFWNESTGETAWEQPAADAVSNQELEVLFTACA